MGTFTKYALLVGGSTAAALGVLMCPWEDERFFLLLAGVPYMACRCLPCNLLGLGFIHPALGFVDVFGLYFASLFIPAFLYMETGFKPWAYLQAGCIAAHFLGGFGFIWRAHGI